MTPGSVLEQPRSCTSLGAATEEAPSARSEPWAPSSAGSVGSLRGDGAAPALVVASLPELGREDLAATPGRRGLALRLVLQEPASSQPGEFTFSGRCLSRNPGLVGKVMAVFWA